MYFITCFGKCGANELGWFDYGDKRTFGYYEDYDNAKTAVEANSLDIHEGIYAFAVIERILPGTLPLAEEIAWFRWDDEKDEFVKTDKPECTYGTCNHAFG